MAREVRIMKASERQNREQLADFLVGLADQIRAGEVIFVQGSETVSTELPENVKVDIEIEDEHKRRGTKRELEIEISWYHGDDGPAEGHAPIQLG